MTINTSLQRALALFNRLRKEPASKQQLLTLLSELASDAYSNLTAKATERKFERDLGKLRDGLLADVFYDSQQKQYVLYNAGPLLSLSLSDETMRAIAFLYEITADNRETRVIIQPLLDTLSRLVGV
ncbi:MAG TPA: hypothetical protein ENJ56_05315, partial [Anaerolineae bacterium]|nr:hypothetical protein [Anaerolineae bacterium]